MQLDDGRAVHAPAKILLALQDPYEKKAVLEEARRRRAEAKAAKLLRECDRVVVASVRGGPRPSSRARPVRSRK